MRGGKDRRNAKSRASAAGGRNACRRFTFTFVLRQMPLAFLYYIVGSLLGAAASFALFAVDKSFLEFVLTVWFKRLLLGLTLLGSKNYTLWFVINNMAALMLVIIASVMIMMLVLGRRATFEKSWRFKRFGTIERRRPRITLFGIRIVPVGALLINGFLIAMFATYVLLGMGYDYFVDVVMLLLPHGINEVVALVIASSVGLAYIRILSPFILARRWDDCTMLGKSMLKSRVTFFFMTLIAILVVFSGFLEGALGLFVIG
jgi:hypothetical protein